MPKPEGERSCTTCHGTDQAKPGRHQRTGKVIESMAPSVNPQRLTDVAKIEKWFVRNCKWTLGRECSAQEKGDAGLSRACKKRCNRNRGEMNYRMIPAPL